MKVIKYKKLRGEKYLVYLDNNSEIELYEDTILKYEMLLNKEFYLDEVICFNNSISAYYEGIFYIKKRLRSVWEVRRYLEKIGYIEEDINKAISKMIELSFLNDLVLARGIVHNRITLSNKGVNFIKKELQNIGVDDTIILEALNGFTIEEQIRKIEKIINKMINSNKNKSGVMLRKSISLYLVNLGHDSNLVNQLLNEYRFDTSNDILKKEEEKLRKKLSRKFDGDELDYQIRLKLKIKGFK